MTIWAATGATEQKQKDLAQTILGALAEEIHVTDEKYLGMATILGGSERSYVLLEALVDTGVRIGLPRLKVRESVIQTIPGSVRTVEGWTSILLT